MLPLLALLGCATTGEPRGLVDLRKAVPGIAVDLRYATSGNVTGQRLYPPDMPCLARKETADKLARAQAILQKQGYGLLIWDAWRPPEAHQLLHRRGQATGLFQDPMQGWSRHCAGIAVDATLVDARGYEQRMPTQFDESLDGASRTYTGGDPEIRRNVQILHQAMVSSGLRPVEAEWWHFDDVDYLNKPQRIIFAHELGIELPNLPSMRVPSRGATLLLAEPPEP